MADPIVYNAILEATAIAQTAVQAAAAAAAIAGLASCPTNSANWTLLPLLSSPIGCLCVYDTVSGYLRCGATCSWTVPAGVTQAQFQLWGAGAGSGMGCCCGGSNFGSTGAFATVIIPVTAGSVYTLCAGCSYCCYVDRTQNSDYENCPSYVTGTGLTNFCAKGGFRSLYRQMTILQGGSPQCRYQAPGNTSSGPCICNSSTDYCFSNSCASCGLIPYTPDVAQTYYGTTTSGAKVLGLPSIHSEACFDTNHYGYFRSPPMIGPCHTVQTGSQCCFAWSSGSCGGCLCNGSCGTFPYPGMGGFGTHFMGGTTSGFTGDAGRGGMVRVTWK